MTYTRTPIGGEPESPRDVSDPPPPWRVAFAPTDVVGTIVISPPWRESPDYLYGAYIDIYDLQP